MYLLRPDSFCFSFLYQHLIFEHLIPGNVFFSLLTGFSPKNQGGLLITKNCETTSDCLSTGVFNLEEILIYVPFRIYFILLCATSGANTSLWARALGMGQLRREGEQD